MPQSCFFFPRDLALKVYLIPSPAFKTTNKTQTKIKSLQLPITYTEVYGGYKEILEVQD